MFFHFLSSFAIRKILKSVKKLVEVCGRLCRSVMQSTDVYLFDLLIHVRACVTWPVSEVSIALSQLSLVVLNNKNNYF